MQHSALLEVLLKEKDPGVTDKDLLEKTAKQYPYFSPIQFFYLQQLKQDDAAYQQQVTRTGILFNNPYWLHFQLQEEAAVEPVTPKAFIEADEPTEEIIHEAPVVEEEVIPEPVVAENLHDNVVMEEAAIDAITSPVEETIHEVHNESAPESVVVENLQDSIPVETAVVNDNEAADIVTPEEESDTSIHEAALPVAETITTADEILANTGNETPAAEIVAQQEQQAEETVMTDEDDTEEDLPPQTESNLEPMKINIPAPVIPATSENALSFEPMHMVDYFASQGIKLSEDAQTADKLGKQLKSFTEWLKTMKKIHTPAPGGTAVNQDITVQNLAEKSNKEGEVVTEAMAEVLAQQGKAGKAVEVYKKLSLLNPSKNAYFAAKIEQLKGS